MSLDTPAMRSKWTHSICNECWYARNPQRHPVRVIQEYRGVEACCFCNETHTSGIYVRENPDSPTLKCDGLHISYEKPEGDGTYI